MKSIIKSGFAALNLALLAACGGGGDAPAAPGGVAPPTSGVAPVTTPPVVAPPAVVIPPVVAPPAVAIPPVVGVPPAVITPPLVAAPPAENPVSPLPATSTFRPATIASLNACPSAPNLLGGILNWSDCLVGQKFVGVPFGSGTCELLVQPNGSFTYTDNSGSYTIAPRSRQLVRGESVFGEYQNQVNPSGYNEFTGRLGITTNNEKSAVVIFVNSDAARRSADRPGPSNNSRVTVDIGYDFSRVCRLFDF